MQFAVGQQLRRQQETVTLCGKSQSNHKFMPTTTAAHLKRGCSSSLWPVARFITSSPHRLHELHEQLFNQERKAAKCPIEDDSLCLDTFMPLVA